MEINIKTLPPKINKNDLESHWWFRLCKVIYVLSFIFGFIILYFVAQSSAQHPVYNSWSTFPVYEVNDAEFITNIIGYSIVNTVFFLLVRWIFLYIVAGSGRKTDSL